MQKLSVQLEIPGDILLSLNETNKEFGEQMKLYTAMQLYNEHKLSVGKAAELSGLSRDSFIEKLGSYNIPLINYDIEDLIKETEHLCQQ